MRDFETKLMLVVVLAVTVFFTITVVVLGSHKAVQSNNQCCKCVR